MNNVNTKCVYNFAVNYFMFQSLHSAHVPPRLCLSITQSAVYVEGKEIKYSEAIRTII